MLRSHEFVKLSLLAVGVTVLGLPLSSVAGEPDAAKQQLRIQEAARAQRQYRTLFEDLGLTAEQQAQFLNVIAVERTQGDQPSMEDNWRRINGDFSTSQDTITRISDIIGADRISAFEQYEQQFREQARVSKIGEKFAASSVSLSTDQTKRLVQIFVTERERISPPVTATAIQSFDDLETYLHWQTDYDERVLKSAGAALTARQRELLKEEFEVRALKRQLALEKQRSGTTLGFFWYPAE